MTLHFYLSPLCWMFVLSVLVAVFFCVWFVFRDVQLFQVPDYKFRFCCFMVTFHFMCYRSIPCNTMRVAPVSLLKNQAFIIIFCFVLLFFYLFLSLLKQSPGIVFCILWASNLNLACSLCRNWDLQTKPLNPHPETRPFLPIEWPPHDSDHWIHSEGKHKYISTAKVLFAELWPGKKWRVPYSLITLFQYRMLVYST